MTRNLLIQFQNDTIDESPRLQEILQSNSTTAPQLAYRVLPGDHTRPLLQTVQHLSTLAVIHPSTCPQSVLYIVSCIQ